MSLQPRIVIPIWSFIKSGGMRVLTMLANNFYEYGYDTLIVTYYKSDVPYFPVKCPIQYVDENGNITEMCQRKLPRNIVEFNCEKRIKHLSLKNALNRLANDYDVVIANYHLTAFAVNESIFLNKFYYIQAYEAWYKGVFGCIYNHFAKKSYRLDLIKIVNSNLYKDYKEIKSQYVVPPGLDLALYYLKSSEKYWDGKRPFVIGHIGRTEVWKGSKDVADAVKILQDEGENIIYKVAFNAPKEGSCNYELVKPDGDNNLAEYYRSVDVIVAPGHQQHGAIHYPVIEAMACGTPVITTGYYPANHDNAYIIGVKSPNEIACAIKSIMTDYELAMSKVNKSINEIKSFSWDAVSHKMISIIEENLKR